MGRRCEKFRGGVRGGLIVVGFAGVTGCLLFTSLSDLTGGEAPTPQKDATQDVAADGLLDVAAPDASDAAYASCFAAHGVLPGANDGVYAIQPDDGGTPFNAYCDMTHDDGGWMLVTPDMILSDITSGVTTVHSIDDKGGLIVQDYPNANPCGADGGPPDSNVLTLSNHPAWSQVRARYAFDGLASCWSVFGAPQLRAMTNLVSFDPAIDTIYDQVKMGGLADGGHGDTFDGVLHRCDQDSANFWQQNMLSARSAVVILRRDLPGPAGPATAAYCLRGEAPGTAATTWWEYRDIYVR